jgi:hypothetical protein
VAEHVLRLTLTRVPARDKHVWGQVPHKMIYPVLCIRIRIRPDLKLFAS